MITQKQYDELKRRYGNISSWAIWNKKFSELAPKENTEDLSIFDSPDLLNIIGTEYVFVGLNASSTNGDISQGTCAWYKFHSNYSGQNDYKSSGDFKGIEALAHEEANIVKEVRA